VTDPATPAHPALRADIQGMRAVAVGLVILAHAGVAGFAGGYVGVDVFFVISGFLITGILARSVRRTGRISIADFYARRARRILPASTVALVAICVGSALVYTSDRLHQVLGDAGWAAVFAANLHYASAGTGYFDNDSFVSPVQHFWSLAVEEQFYLVWPLLLVGCAALATTVLRRRASVPDGLERRLGLRYGVIAIAALCLLSVLWSVFRTEDAPLPAYFSTFTRGYELGIGALLALVAGACARLPAPVKAAASWTGLVAIAVAATTYSAGTPFPGAAALLPVLGAALVLAGGVDGPRYGAVALLALRPVRWTGDISYSLYLWHWPCLILPAAYLGRELGTGETVVVVALAFLAAWLSYRFVEEPFRRSRALDRRRLRALVLWPVSLALVLGAAGTVWVQQEWQDRHQGAYAVPDVDPEPRTVQKASDPLVNDVGFAAELTRAGYRLPAKLRPAVADLRADVTPLSGYDNPDDGCFAEKPEVTSEVCVTGDPAGTRTVVALGDSHMGMWLAPVTQLAAAHGTRVVPLLKQRCMPFDVLQYEPDLGRRYDECVQHGAWVEKQLRTLKPDLVVVSALYLTDLVDPASGKVLDRDAANTAFDAGARRTLARLTRLADRVLVIGPTPVLPKASADCLASQRATMAACRAPLRSQVVARDRILGRATAATGAEYLRMLPWFCDAERTCPIVVRDRIVYRDATHITQTYAEHLQPVFARALHLTR